MKVYVKGEANQPHRFYKYLLCNTKEEEQRAILWGFRYTEKDTKDYVLLSEKEKSKISFYKPTQWQIDVFEKSKNQQH